jgi:EAL and modified HD-GYP domain-containing signal transduction protein
MATQELDRGSDPSEPPAAASDLFISRQPVVDGQMRVTGYRVAYATADGSAPADATAARLLGDVLSGVGLDELVGDALAHLPLSRELLLALGVPPVRPDRVLLRIPHETACDSEVASVLDALTGRGYALSLHDLPGPDFDAALLDLFGTVEVELRSWSPDDAARAVARIQAARAMPLAAGLRDYNEFEQAKDLGFDLFSGPFYASRHKAAVRNVPVGEMGTLVALAALQGSSATIEELEQVIDRDVGLSVKLLRYINSAYIGMRGSIGSIRQAVMMLGSRGVSRWALLVALTGGPNTPRELSVMGLTRARMCELLGADLRDVAGEQLFTVGLLSVADALLEVPLETIVEELPLADEVSAALLRRDGPAGAILKVVVSYEQGDFDVATIRSHAPGIASSYRDALGWAVETVSTLAA